MTCSYYVPGNQPLCRWPDMAKVRDGGLKEIVCRDSFMHECHGDTDHCMTLCQTAEAVNYVLVTLAQGKAMSDSIIAAIDWADKARNPNP
jgi:hypothetical protein